MSPILRSVISQARRSWRSVAPRRNFSSSPRESNGIDKTHVSPFVIRGLAMGVGYLIGEIYWHDWVQERKRNYDESMEYIDQSEKRWDYLIAEGRPKPRAALLSDRQF